MWYDDYYFGDGDHWDNDDDEDKIYKKRKAQKASIKELLPIAWHPSRYWDWCMSEDEKKQKQKNYGHKHESVLYLMTRYKNFLTQKEQQIKMSSLLNVSNDASRKPEKFSLKDIEVIVDSKEQKWFKRAHVGKFLGIENIRTSLNDLDKCEMLTRQELVLTRRSTSPWFRPNDQQNKTDRFLSFLRMM